MTISDILKDSNYSLELLEQYRDRLIIDVKSQKNGLVSNEL